MERAREQCLGGGDGDDSPGRVPVSRGNERPVIANRGFRECMDASCGLAPSASSGTTRRPDQRATVFRFVHTSGIDYGEGRTITPRRPSASAEAVEVIGAAASRNRTGLEINQ